MKKLFVIFLILYPYNISYCDELRWAADTESGAPNVFYDSDNNLCGFEKEIIEEVCNKLNKTAVFCQNDWEWLIPGLGRGLYEVIIDGLSNDESRNKSISFSIPYYACSLSLLVRENVNNIHTLDDCCNKRVGTLRNSKAQRVLKNFSEINVIDYPTEYGAFSDLKNGRIDAVLIDYPAALYCGLALGGLKIVNNFDEIKYSIAINNSNCELIALVNQSILEIIKNGKLQTIINKWNLDNEIFQQYITQIKNNNHTAYNTFISEHPSYKLSNYIKLIPFFTKAAIITLEVSIAGMILAVIFGISLVLLRIYSPKWLQFIVISLIEILRGTPLLIQLFFIFYGWPFIGITLQPLLAGILALGINYAAYESENFRAGLMAVPRGQMEAARALGMSQWQSLRYVIIPQAFSFVLPPLTNDFISIIKDSSLVSLITIVELTKAYTTAASSSFDFFGTGIMVAIFYFLLGFPFVRLAKLAENHLALEKRAYKAKRVTKK